MNFSFFIARRYFSDKRNTNFVHIISWVSLFGVTIGTAALVLVLSVFNGFEELILNMYNSFDPHLKITATTGKTFGQNDAVIHLQENEKVLCYSSVLEEKVLLKNKDREYIATVKGVDEQYKQLSNFDSLLVEGAYIDEYESSNVAIIGRGIAYHLSQGVGNVFNQLQVFVPNRSSKTLLNPNTAFKQSTVMPVGVFGVQAEIDNQYIITPLSFVQTLLAKPNLVSAVEVRLQDDELMLSAQDELQKLLGEQYKVQNRLEQQQFLYKMLNTEKLAIFIILTFIMIIATFNIVGSLSMLMLDKKNDIHTFRSLGATRSDVQKIFFNRSMLTVFFGILIGLTVGLLLAYLQQNFGFISMGGGSFVIDTYPVAIVFSDVLLVSITVFTIGLLASWYPAKVLGRRLFKN